MLLEESTISTVGSEAKEQCNPWDLWYEVMEWAPKPLYVGEVIDLSNPEEKGRIQDMKFVAVLFSQIESLGDVRSLFGNVGVRLASKQYHHAAC